MLYVEYIKNIALHLSYKMKKVKVCKWFESRNNELIENIKIKICKLFIYLLSGRIISSFTS